MSLAGVVAVIDNYDSFTYNLVHFLGELGAGVEVFRNDALSAAELARQRPAAVVISPGPGRPEQAGISLEVVRLLGASTPLLGVCLGHQVIGQAYGGRVARAPTVMHGKVGEIHHRGGGCLRGLPQPFAATRYHSLAVERESLPSALEVTAWSEDGVIMALRHREHPVEGVQFHPESIATQCGHHLLRNFLEATEVAGAPAPR